MKTIYAKDYTLTYDDSQDAKDRVFERMLKFFVESELFNGESLQQCDTTHIEGPEVLSDVAEEGFKFQTEWKE